MAFTELNNITKTGLEGIMSFPSLDTPLFYPMFLFTVFTVFTMITFFRELEREGKGNILSSLAISGYVTIAVAVVLNLGNLIGTTTLVVTMVATLVFQVIFLLTNKP